MSSLSRTHVYLLPLIRDWSAEADRPIRCWKEGLDPNKIICAFKNSDTPYPNGKVIVENDGIVYLEYGINPMYLEDVRLIFAGKYSKISLAAKKTILRCSDGSSNYTKLQGILYKSKARKKAIEEELGIEDFDSHCEEYDSKFGPEEVFNDLL